MSSDSPESTSTVRQSGGEGRRPPPAQAVDSDKRPVVLVVDDDATLRILARATLEPQGFTVAEAPDGEQALLLHDAARPSLVLLDVHMPGADGFAVCTELRRRGIQTPVLMMTGSDDVAAIEHAYQVGATDFIGKPLNWTILAHRVRYMLRSSGAAQQLSLLATAVAQAAEAIVVTGPEGEIQYVNPAFEQMTGYPDSEALGRNPRLLKSGRQDEGFYARMWSALKRGETWRGSLVNRRKTGEFYEEDCAVSAVRGPLGDIVNYVAVKRDVTREKHLERQLREAQRLEALGTLAGGIAHDFNNLLTPIIGYAELAAGLQPDGNPVRRHLGKILGAAERAKDLVKQIMSFSQQDLATRRPLRLAALVGDALSLVKASAPTSIQVRQRPHAGSDVVLADGSQLHQVLLNLCTNAVHAMRSGGGALEVSLAEVRVGDGHPPPHPALEKGSFVCLSVSDTGHGMPPEVLERIFEPFYTTKGPGEGTGIGLAAIHGIVNRHGGAVTVESEVGRGTTFRVYLPRAEEATVETAPDDDEAEPAEPRTARVLFADDEGTIAGVAREILEELGYSVETAGSGEAALDLFRAAPNRFDLAITDMTMPGMSGTQLARELLDRRPDLPVILSTGYSEAVTPAGAATAGIRELLMKPWTRLELACAVRRALGA